GIPPEAPGAPPALRQYKPLRAGGSPATPRIVSWPTLCLPIAKRDPQSDHSASSRQDVGLNRRRRICDTMTARGNASEYGFVLHFTRRAIYRITRSVLARTLGGSVKPICLAAFRFITNSNFAGCSMGRSAGLAPFKILSTYAAARR